MLRSRAALLCVFLVVASMVLACGVGPQSQTRSAAEAKGYTLRLVFDGLVTFVTPDRSDRPNGPVWVLFGNASEPGQLAVGRGIPPHMSHMLIPENVIVSGRGLENQVPANQDGRDPDVQYRALHLMDEDLSLHISNSRDAGPRKAAIEIIRRTRRLPSPCLLSEEGCDEKTILRQTEDFEWTVDVDQALALVPPGATEKPGDRMIRPCLTASPYSCQGSYPLLGARFKIDRGKVSVQSLLREGDDAEKPIYSVYDFGSHFVGFAKRAIAQEVAVEIQIQEGDLVEFQSAALSGGGRKKKEPIRIQGQPGQTVEIRLGNHPNEHDGNLAQASTANDFLFNFNLVNEPLFAGEEDKLPVPIDRTGDSAWNGQCSPGTFVSGG